MIGHRFTGMWVFLVMSSMVGFAQGQSGSLPPIQTSPTRSNYPPPGGINPMGSDPSAAPDALSARIVEQQARTRNAERQKRLEADTDKLVGLVTDFKQQVQSERKLSPDDVGKRAEEIEKLARSVKDRMKG
ncbi:hypothetical protein [Edaphobacter albus]|uniref:hypothetical protein n=1 Tax=Edaphobacter sp. 4G125 TaxID=2763071 RepID=UPI0016455D9B|nr:hypothetical protein [Edaphobacter sp. 4G125]QNI35291.1 hypothetical protein H7846_09245 [Edaphobacter sp. 4G125]